MPSSGVFAPYRTLDDTGRVKLSSEVVKETAATTTMKSGKTSTIKIRETPMQKVLRVLDVQMNNQTNNSFTGVADTEMRACFNRSS